MTDKYAEMRVKFQQAVDSESDLRQYALDDIRFVWVEGWQWDDKSRRIRQAAGRPCYEYNKLKPTIKQVINDQRQNRPQIKLRATEEGDKSTADVLQGLIRNIEATSNADLAYDEAFKCAVTCGYGVFRIATEYSDDNGFDQCIKILPVRNPFSVYFDANAKAFDRRDARCAWVTELVSREEFKSRWPKAEMVSFSPSNVGDTYMDRWWQEDQVRIAEYWYKKKEKKRIYRLSSGEVVDAKEFDPVADELAQPQVDEMGQMVREPILIEAEREVEYDCVYMEMVSGTQTLEGPTKWAGKYIPIIPVWGELTNVDGRDRYMGLTRTARDAQTNYNYHRSVTQETIANAPKSPFLVTPKMVAGHERQWENIGVANDPALMYNPDPDAPNGRPTREGMSDMPVALIQAAQLDSEDLKAVTGIYDASLGARSNETSGKAILARQRESDVSTFDFLDNLSRSIRYEGEILVDLIPHIYDTQRIVRILGEDGTEEYVELNKPIYDQQTGKWVTLNDLNRGKYDVAVSVGPSYTTQRMETAEAMLQLSQGTGPLAELAKYAAVKNMDIPGSDEVLKAMRKQMVMANLLDPNEEDAPPPPPQPDPKMMADAEYTMARAEKTKAETQKIVTMLPIDQAKQVAEVRNIVENTNDTAFNRGMQGGF
jgi:rubrerythrin